MPVAVASGGASEGRYGGGSKLGDERSHVGLRAAAAQGFGGAVRTFWQAFQDEIPSKSFMFFF